MNAIREFPTPKTRTDVRSFCGLVQQFEALTPRITELTTPLRSLLSPKVAFSWGNDQEVAFRQTIEELCSGRVLTNFNPKARLRLETDAAQKTGLGYALWQEEASGQWKLLRCGSRTVTPAESRYSVTESELLGVAFAVKKLKLYLQGKAFEVIVDHQPLVSILNSKGLEEIETPRILRLKEKLTGYVFTAIWR